MTLIVIILTFSSIRTKYIDVTRIARQTLRATNTHKIRQINMRKRIALMHERERERTNVTWSHVNRSTIEKWLANALLAKSVMRNLSLIIFTCESLFTFFRKIHYQISQQTSDISVFNTFHHLVSRTLHADEISDITFFTILRQQTSVNILQISFSQKISATRSVI